MNYFAPVSLKDQLEFEAEYLAFQLHINKLKTKSLNEVELIKSNPEIYAKFKVVFLFLEESEKLLNEALSLFTELKE